MEQNKKPFQNRGKVRAFGTQEEERESVIQEMNARIPLVRRNTEIFEKTPLEKKALKAAISNHNKTLRKAGFISKKRMNTSEPSKLVL